VSFNYPKAGALTQRVLERRSQQAGARERRLPKTVNYQLAIWQRSKKTTQRAMSRWVLVLKFS
jgi:hypothetical protein